MTVFNTPRTGSFDSAVALLAAGQLGAISRGQALELGAKTAAIQRRVRSGRWRRTRSGVYVVGGVPASWMQDVWCAFLAIGPAAVVTHETALRIHRMGEVPDSLLTFTVPHGDHARLPGVFVHQIDDLRSHRVRTISGLPVSTPERVIVELAAGTGERRLGRLLDGAVAAKRTTYARAAGCMHEVFRPGKPGMVKLASVLDARGDGFVPPHSELERALFAALAAGGLPAPRRQHPLPGRGAVNGLVDAAYPDARLIVEADGRRWHTRIDDLKRDHLRDTEAARAGWLTLRFVYEQIVHDPADVCAAIRDVRTSRLASAAAIGVDTARLR